MADKLILKPMHCPTCGGNLKAENDTDSITCVYCGNTIIPVSDRIQHNAPTPSGTVRVDGIKTSASALAYIELFFEEYDWEAFVFAQSLSIAQIDHLVASLKNTSADDKNTWLVCFQSIYVPYVHKVSGCKGLLESVIRSYENADLDAYSQFDAYKRIASIIHGAQEKTIQNLKKTVANAARYGASATEINGLNADIESIKALELPALYDNIGCIPAIRNFNNQKDTAIAAELAKIGINAKQSYATAIQLISERKYVQALNVLLSLDGYADSEKLAEKIDRYYLIFDVLEVGGKLYYYKSAADEYNSINLYPTENGKICTKPIIKNISQIITNYADILYYLDTHGEIRKYNLTTGEKARIFEGASPKEIHVYNQRAYLLSTANQIVALTLSTGDVQTIPENVTAIQSLIGNKLTYTASEECSGNRLENITKILNLDTGSITKVSNHEVLIQGFTSNHVVYTRVSPTVQNNDLYAKKLDSEDPEQLIEKNIYGFCKIISGKLFYYVGNSANQSLININLDGSERKELPLFISRVLFEQSGWIYFIRKAGYTTILCKSRLDGSDFRVIAADIEEFIQLKNGYLYYINDAAKLMRVRMDGSNLQTLCDGVEKVLSVKEDRIVFVSVDGHFFSGEEYRPSRTIRSIYAVDFDGSGRRKLVYDIKRAKEHDEDTVYFIGTTTMEATYDTPQTQLDTLYRLDIRTGQVGKLLDIEVKPERAGCSGFAIAMMLIVLGFLLSIIGFASGEEGLGIFGLLMGVVCVMISAIMKADNH